MLALRSPASLSFGITLSALTAWLACSPATGTGINDGPSTATGGQLGYPGGGGTSGLGGGILNPGGSLLNPGGAGHDNACVTNNYAGERQPLDMYFLVDTSGSMNQDAAGGTTKWDAVSTALVGFLNDPANGDIGVGIGYFPQIFPGAPPGCTIQTDCGNFGRCVGGIPADWLAPGAVLGGNCDGADACNAPAYATPDVPLALPPNPGAVVQNIQAKQRGGGTPTRPAIEGALQIATGWAQQNPGRTTILVLATDGQPTGCQNNNPQTVADAAGAALNGPNRIRTYVIGVGDELADLNLVAQAGGSGQAYLVDTGTDVAAQFAAALAAIRGQAVPCDFTIPQSGDVNPNEVNLSFTPNGGGQPLPIHRTNDGTAATCGDQDGWFYDNLAAPTKVQVCDATCAKLVTGSVQFQLGCQTIVAPPR